MSDCLLEVLSVSDCYMRSCVCQMYVQSPSGLHTNKHTANNVQVSRHQTGSILGERGRRYNKACLCAAMLLLLAGCLTAQQQQHANVSQEQVYKLPH